MSALPTPRIVSFTLLGDQKITERFMAKVSPEALTGCWLWTGAPSDNTKNGLYGRFRVHGAQIRAHRVSWLLHRGEIPENLQVLHHCDNQACVRPDHLFLGTNEDNVADRVAKGRTGWKHRQGDEHPMRKLDEQRVRRVG